MSELTWTPEMDEQRVKATLTFTGPPVVGDALRAGAVFFPVGMTLVGVVTEGETHTVHVELGLATLTSHLVHSTLRAVAPAIALNIGQGTLHVEPIGAALQPAPEVVPEVPPTPPAADYMTEIPLVSGRGRWVLVSGREGGWHMRSPMSETTQLGSSAASVNTALDEYDAYVETTKTTTKGAENAANSTT